MLRSNIFLAVFFLASSVTTAHSAAAHGDKEKCACKGHTLTNGLFVRLVAKPGKEAELAKFLRDAQPLAEAEAGTPLCHI
jgi:hypothetical protein